MSRRKPKARKPPARVLIVDDHPAVREALAIRERAAHRIPGYVSRAVETVRALANGEQSGAAVVHAP